MAIRLYMDQHVPRSVTNGLHARGVDVITAFEDSADRKSDAELLNRATELDRVLFTQDDDLLVLASAAQSSGFSFTDVIYAHQLQITIGKCVQDLELIARAGEPEDMLNQVQFLPL